MLIGKQQISSANATRNDSTAVINDTLETSIIGQNDSAVEATNLVPHENKN